MSAPQLPPPERDSLTMAAVLFALGDETRLCIVRQLADEGGCMCSDVQQKMPKSSRSHHLRVLRECGVIVSERKGTTLINRLRREDLNVRFPGLLDAILTERPAKTAKPRRRPA